MRELLTSAIADLVRCISSYQYLLWPKILKPSFFKMEESVERFTSGFVCVCHPVVVICCLHYTDSLNLSKGTTLKKLSNVMNMS